MMVDPYSVDSDTVVVFMCTSMATSSVHFIVASPPPFLLRKVPIALCG